MWWAVTGSNRRPSRCKRDALPAELTAHASTPATPRRQGQSCRRISRGSVTHAWSSTAQPRRIGDDLLAASGLERQNLQFLFIAVDKPTEQEAAGGAGDEHVAVERSAHSPRAERFAPHFVAGPIIADTGTDHDRDLAILHARWDDDRRLARRGRSARAEDRGDLELGAFATFDRDPAPQPRAPCAMRFSQPTETVRVPVSRRPMVCGVVGGSQPPATSSSVIPRARRTSLIRVIILDPPK